jgi:hypothetical protein
MLGRLVESWPGRPQFFMHTPGISIINRRKTMATYECEKCGMSVNATCGQCDAPLENDVLKLDNGNEVQISKCPNGHGKIKSPLCCGQDMSCSIG